MENHRSDKELIKARFAASFGRYNRLALVQQRICEVLMERFVEMNGGVINRALEIGAGTGFLTSHLTERFPTTRWYLNDLVPEAEKYLCSFVGGMDYAYLWGDAEQVEFPSGLELIASSSTVQWFDDMSAFARRSAAATADGGWLLLSTFGMENFKEIRTTTGEGLYYYDIEQLKEIFEKAGYEVPLIEEYIETMSFETPLDVLHHIKATGVNSVRKTHWTRRHFREFDQLYRDHFTTQESKVQLTYHPILLIGKKI